MNYSKNRKSHKFNYFLLLPVSLFTQYRKINQLIKTTPIRQYVSTYTYINEKIVIKYISYKIQQNISSV